MEKDPKVFERMLDDAETRLDRLRALYEQWFQGLERLEPTIPRKNFDRFMEQLRRDRPRVTGLKFRYHNLVQRYTTYVMYWRKVARQIEEGTYRRDVLRARKVREEARQKYRHERESKKAEKDGGAAEGEAPAEAAKQPAEAAKQPAQQPASGSPAAATEAPGTAPPATPAPSGPAAAKPASAAPASTPQPSPAPPAPGSKQVPVKNFPAPAGSQPAAGAAAVSSSSKPSGPARSPVPSRPSVSSGPAAGKPASGTLSEQQLRSLYDRYVSAKTRNNESADINYEKLARKVSAMVPELQKKHAGKQIDFDVVIRNGRVALKPVVK